MCVSCTLKAPHVSVPPAWLQVSLSGSGGESSRLHSVYPESVKAREARQESLWMEAQERVVRGCRQGFRVHVSGGHRVFERNRESDGFGSGILVNFMLPSRSLSQQLRPQDTVPKDFPPYTINSKPTDAAEASSSCFCTSLKVNSVND